MTNSTARDFCQEALTAAGIKANGTGASQREERADRTFNEEFTMDPQTGLTVRIEKRSGKSLWAETVWLAAPFAIIGRVRDTKNEGWARQLSFRDDDGHTHEYPVTDGDLHGDPSLLCAKLASLGLRVTTGPSRAHLVRYLNRVEVAARVTIFSRTGWHEVNEKKIFVIPGGVADGNQRYIIASAAASPYEKRGTLADWQGSVSELVVGHNRLMFGLATAFAPPLLNLTGGESGGFNVRGSSSIGKTTLLCSAASVWGRANEHGMVRTWRATSNGLESTATVFSDTLLPLDELGMASPQEVGNIVYSLASGIGKQRSQRDGSARLPNTWRVMVLSTGELGIGEKIREAGGRPRAGQGLRILDIDGDAGKGFGVFDHGGPDGDAGKLASAIKQATVTCYGTAGPAFVAAILAQGVDRIASNIRAAQDALTKRIASDVRNGQILRAAERFALCGVAGELAIQLGILPWPPGVVAAATQELFATWRKDRGEDPGEIRGAFEQIRILLERYGDSRFDPANRALDTRPAPDRLGWVRADSDSKQWLIPPGVWKNVFCQGYDPKVVARALSERGMLLLDAERKFSRSERVDGKVLRVYVLTEKVRTDNSEEVAL